MEKEGRCSPKSEVGESYRRAHGPSVVRYVEVASQRANERGGKQCVTSLEQRAREGKEQTSPHTKLVRTWSERYQPGEAMARGRRLGEFMTTAKQRGGRPISAYNPSAGRRPVVTATNLGKDFAFLLMRPVYLPSQPWSVDPVFGSHPQIGCTDSVRVNGMPIRQDVEQKIPAPVEAGSVDGRGDSTAKVESLHF